MDYETKKNSLVWLVRLGAVILMLFGIWQIKESKGYIEDVLGLSTAANTQACELLNGDSDLNATLFHMESRAQGTLKEKLTSYLEFENSDTYTANSAAEAQRDLASVYQICTDLLANKVYKK